MKKYTSLALIGALVVGIAGFISLDAISATSFVTMKAASDIRETGQMIGHVTYELRGADGNMKYYFQSDNLIVDLGTDCAAQAIFDNGDNDVCGLGANGGFGFIAIGNATGATADATDVALDTSDGGSANFGAGGGDEMTRSGFIDATITAAGGGADTTVSIASPAFTFADLGPAGSTVITQSGLFDSDTTGTNNMFSIRDIPGQGGNGLTVTSADTLSVTWTITLE